MCRKYIWNIMKFVVRFGCHLKDISLCIGKMLQRQKKTFQNPKCFWSQAFLTGNFNLEDAVSACKIWVLKIMNMRQLGYFLAFYTCIFVCYFLFVPLFRADQLPSPNLNFSHLWKKFSYVGSTTEKHNQWYLHPGLALPKPCCPQQENPTLFPGSCRNIAAPCGCSLPQGYPKLQCLFF